LGSFLKLIAKRIEDFKSYLARSGETHTESIDSANSLQRLMSGQVSSLLEAVDDETNFRAIKPAVINQLEDLEFSLTAFVGNEQHRHSVAVTEMGQVAGRFEELENETQRLRADLKAQRILTLIDSLTGVFNRLGYTEGIAREQARWRRYGGALSIAMCDLDLFKNINDQYGHPAGDKVLVSVAELLGAQIRDCDVLCRLGGEEFVVILPETTLEGAKITAEKLRLSIFNSKFRFKNEPVSVSISIGVAQFRIEDSAADVYDRADRAMYVAKSQGRNRCCSEQDIATE
jgi:diguanylate cyclase